MTNELKDQSCVEGPLCALGWVWPLGLSLKSTGTVGLPSRIYKLLNNKTHVKSLITTQDMGETPSADSLRFMPSRAVGTQCHRCGDCREPRRLRGPDMHLWR